MPKIARWLVFTKKDCPVCDKAKAILESRGVKFAELPTEWDTAYVGDFDARLKARAMFAWIGEADKMPLVAALDADDGVLARWDGADISDKKHAWTPALDAFLNEGGGCA